MTRVPYKRIQWKGKADPDKNTLFLWEAGIISTTEAILRVELNNQLDPGSISEGQFRENAEWLGYRRKHLGWLGE